MNKFYWLRNIFLLFLYFTLLIGFLLGEDSLGRAKADFSIHLHLIKNFQNNFKDTIDKYGSLELSYRNSPIFYIIFSIILKKFENIDMLRFFNLNISLLAPFIFYKCLQLKYRNTKKTILLLIASSILLSPTYRSLSIWPYPFLYALIFFLLSIYFFLRWEKNKNKINYFFFSNFFLIISSYITPNFSVFFLLYIFFFIKEHKIGYKSFFLLFINFILSLPAILFLIKKNFYLFQNDVIALKLLDKINYSNKIILISTIFFFHIIPFLFLLKEKILILSKKKLLYVLFIYILLISTFSFRNNSNAGGGFFYHLSIYTTGSNYLLFLTFLPALIIIFNLSNKSIKNILLFFCLIIFNLQYSIYHKYYDPLILIIFFLLFNNDLDKKHLIYKNILYLYFFSIFYLTISLNKDLIKNLLLTISNFN